MAVATWPGYALITARQTISAAPSVRRTEFDDGAVRQARSVARPIMRTEIEADILGDRLAEFQAWAALHASTYFTVATLGLGARGMRVVGGVGGITYEQVRRAGGLARWLARMTLEDAGSAAAGAPFFGAGADARILARRAVPLHLVLPAAIGGAGTLRYALSPAPPGGLVLDAATRTITGTPSAVAAITPYTWTATDAYGRVATVTIPLGVAFYAARIAGQFTATAGAVRLTWGDAPPATPWMPAAWTAPGDNSGWLNYFEVTSAGRVAMGLGLPGAVNPLKTSILSRLRVELKHIDTAIGVQTASTEEFGGPDAAAARARDTTEPYEWTPSAAAVARIEAFVGAAVTTGAMDLYIWEEPW